MEQLPVFLNLRGWPCLVVGAGPVGAGRAEALAAAGGRVRVVAPEACESAADLAREGAVELRRGRFEASDLEGRRLVVAATGDQALNRRIVALAESRGILANSASDARRGHFSMPAIVDRSPVLAAVSTGGASPSLARYVRARLETLIPRSFGRLAELARAARPEVNARLPRVSDRRAFWDRVFEGPIAEMAFAGRIEEARAALAAALAAAPGGASGEAARDAPEAGEAPEAAGGTQAFPGRPRRKGAPEAAASPEAAGSIEAAALSKAGDGARRPATGEVYLVGAGPGDPDLLHLPRHAPHAAGGRGGVRPPRVPRRARPRAARCGEGLRGEAPGRARDPAARHQPPPRPPRARGPARAAAQGRGPVRLRAGRRGDRDPRRRRDPVPGRARGDRGGGLRRLRRIPLTHRDHAHACTFVTGNLRNGRAALDWPAVARPGQTVVVYMGLVGLRQICEGLVEHGLDPATPAALVEQGTTERQRVVEGDLATLAERVEGAGVEPPTLVIVGEVVRLRGKLDWFRADPRGAEAPPRRAHATLAYAGPEPAEPALPSGRDGGGEGAAK